MHNKGYIVDLGLMEYGEAWALQHHLWSKRVEGKLPDLLLFVEHPHVITLGRRGNRAHLLASQDVLKERSISLFHVERGGDITYHGPGQMVVYPMLNLRDYGYRVVRYVEQIEEVILRVLGDFGIQGRRDGSNRGIWVNQEKIASIGVAIKQWVSFHGLAINYGTDLTYFDLIDPCGLEGVKMTSMEKILGAKISWERLGQRLLFHFGEVFQKHWEKITLSELLNDERSTEATLVEDTALPTSGHI